MALVGSYVGLSRLLVAVFPVFLLAWLRFGIAAVAMATWLRRGADEAPLSTHDRWLLFAESFFGNFLFSLCMLWGVQRTSAVAAGIVMSGIPAAVAVFSWLGLGERIRGRTLLGIVCAMAGMALLAFARDSGEPGAAPTAATDGWGTLLLLGAVCCEALYVVIGKRLTAQVSPRRISALVNLWGLLLVTPMGLWQAMRFDFAPVAMGTWTLLAFYALAASMATVWLWMTGLRHVPASQAGVYTVMLPVSAAAVGVGLLGEPFTAMHAAALGMAMLGVVLAGRN